ncbi:pumilio-like protein 2-like [Forsythia ovata]|uniref:Pumilio-like protein 2-like n=1 Tax=Forsythia ovata TaxID=205694 RepID=A0ABD1WJ84_9LAMI
MVELNALQMALPSYLQHMRSIECASSALNDLTINRESMATSYVELLRLQNAYLEASLQRSQYDLAFAKFSYLNNFYGYPAFSLGMSYPGSLMEGPVYPYSLSPIGFVGPSMHSFWFKEHNWWFYGIVAFGTWG